MQRFDLNLLLALDALLEEESVSRAAERLNLTPPAISHALGRLRTVLDDRLLVRAGQRLVPTPRAIAMREEVHATVERALAIFSDRRTPDLAMEQRTFTIRADDGIISAHAAVLTRRIHDRAPGIRLRFMGRFDEGLGPLRDGTVDLDIGVEVDMGPEIRSERICDDSLIGALRAGHPLGAGPVSIKAYAAASHVISSRRGRAAGPIDRRLAEAGLTREAPIIVPDSITALAVAVGTDHIATVPASIARWGRLTMGVATFTLPMEVPTIGIVLSWHPRLDRDPIHRWLRDCTQWTFADARDDKAARSEPRIRTETWERHT